MLLYIIAAEVLANFIDADKRIQGIQIGDHEIKIGNFAKDRLKSFYHRLKSFYLSTQDTSDS